MEIYAPGLFLWPHIKARCTVHEHQTQQTQILDTAFDELTSGYDPPRWTHRRHLDEMADELVAKLENEIVNVRNHQHVLRRKLPK